MLSRVMIGNNGSDGDSSCCAHATGGGCAKLGGSCELVDVNKGRGRHPVVVAL